VPERKEKFLPQKVRDALNKIRKKIFLSMKKQEGSLFSLRKLVVKRLKLWIAMFV